MQIFLQKYTYLLFLLACLATTTSIHAQTCNRQSDSLELVKLYTATNGANWTNKWDLTKPMNTWYGVRMNTTGCVTCIDMDGGVDCVNTNLQGNNLTGTLPNLTMSNLQTLILSYNKISGTIPNFNIPSLSWLVLSGNQFSGAIPALVTPNMQRLILGNNQLTGNIPNFNMPILVLLDISNLKPYKTNCGIKTNK